jgi:hypothetical protein
MSDRERAENTRAESLKDEGDSNTEQETPDVEAHRLEIPRVEDGAENEDRHRNEGV